MRLHAGIVGVRPSVALLLGVLLLVLSGSPAAAGSTVCDPVKTATPGLYGLCIAYCEANDCSITEFKIARCNPLKERVLENYNRRKQANDPEMPCVRSGCPCYTSQDLAIFDGFSLQCVLWDETDENGNLVGQVLSIDRQLGCGGFDAAGARDYVHQQNTCFYQSVNETCDVIVSRPAPSDITEQEADGCFDILLDYCCDNGMLPSSDCPS